MFEKLLDLLEKVWTLATPVVILHPWQGGIVTRWGQYRRTITSEPRKFYPVKWPFVEDYALTETCETTMRLPPQSLATKDDVPVVVSSIVRYRVRDVKRFICDVWDQKDVLADLTMGAIARCVRDQTYEELMKGAPEKEVLKAVRDGVNDYGFQIYQVTFTDRCRARSLRLVLPNAKDLDN